MDVQSEILQQMRALKKRIAHLERLEKLLLLDEDDMSSNSATAPPSQQSVVEYIANQISSVTNQISPVKIVAVEYAQFRGTQSRNTGAGKNFAITNLSIKHAMNNSANRLILLAHVGTLADNLDYAIGGVYFAKDGSRIHVASGGNRRSAAYGQQYPAANYLSFSHSIMAVHSPGTTASKTYTVRVLNNYGVSKTFYVNRRRVNSDLRAMSSFILMEVTS